ncbi:MAG TPA: FdrA family protein [Streptosporangiaceae bacterium]|nr:FdrA family protein [Streptosporangiaceae bacterium]
MSVEHVQARTGGYADSVTLMAVSARAQAVDGVEVALVAMATQLNLDLLDGLGLAAPPGAGEHDLLVAIKAADSDSLSVALAIVDEELKTRPGGGREHDGWQQSPRTTASAAARVGPGIALISVPGQYAFAEALDALNADCDVMIFSDNVPVEQEVKLKEIAAERDLLVMGPDCGTAIVGGVGLGFANSVRRGPVGVVAASGTGAQQLTCLIELAGVGVSAVLGVGGRDLSAAVGGRSARAALAALDADLATELIVLLSKPPAGAVADELREFAAGLTTPVQFALLGPGQPDLTETAQNVLRAVGAPVPNWPSWRPARALPHDAAATGPAEPRRDQREVTPGRTGFLRGLFAGGTLCDEAMVIAAQRLGPIYSNVPLEPSWRIDPRTAAGLAAQAGRHVMIDFGEDELTAGRPHPMIDQRLRLDRLAAEAADPATAVIMLDVVLGYGAHPDPADELAQAIAEAKAGRPELEVVVSLIGTPTDPQGLVEQAAELASAGAHVFASNATAARFACGLITSGNGGN